MLRVPPWVSVAPWWQSGLHLIGRLIYRELAGWKPVVGCGRFSRTDLANGFLFCYGVKPSRAAAFPLLFLFLMVPLPDPLLSWTIYRLQQGSTEISYLLFKAVGIPVLKQGFILSVPGVAIEVATECSGIRSSIALFITCLLAAHLYLRTFWKVLFFVLLVFPLAILKNGIRIVTLTLLSIYVDPGFLRGSFHRDGGFVFFLLALLILFPVFLLLERSESQRQTASPAT